MIDLFKGYLWQQMIAKRTNNFPDDYVKQIPIIKQPTRVLQQKKNVGKKNKKRNT